MDRFDVNFGLIIFLVFALGWEVDPLLEGGVD